MPKGNYVNLVVPLESWRSTCWHEVKKNACNGDKYLFAVASPAQNQEVSGTRVGSIFEHCAMATIDTST